MGRDARASVVGGPAAILLATAVGGGSGYLLTVLAGAVLGPAEYAPFGTLWSVVFFAAAVVAGLQQEIARATTRRLPTVSARPTARTFALVTAVATASVILVTSPWWVQAALPDFDFGVALAVAIGLASYVVTATIAGLLSGLGEWRLVAGMIAGDGILRLALGVLALIVAPAPWVIACALCLPYSIVPALVWATYRRRFVNVTQLDVSLGGLFANVGRATAGAAAGGLLVSGLPAAISLTSASEEPEELGAIIFAIMLVRAPLVIVVLALQSYLVVTFRNSPRPVRLLVWSCVAILLLGAVFALLAAWVGPVLLSAFHAGFALPSTVLALIVVGGALVGVLTAIGAAVIAQSRHWVYASGWLAGSVATLLLLMMPLDFLQRTSLAMVVGPAVGAAIMLAGSVLRGWPRRPLRLR